ncbi:MAG TPA: LysR substrate-binding domain-containing protein [Burkholderiales bacterium]
MQRAAEEALRTLKDAVQRIAPDSRQNLVTVTSSIAFCSLWLIPRLTAFRKLHPDVDVRISADNQVLDLDRERIDVGIRYCPAEKAPRGSIRLFGEEILPVCSPALLKDRSRPLKSVSDLKHHVLLHYDESDRLIPWMAWSVWLESAGVPELKPAGSLRFSHYDQVVNAAIGGQGVALGRRPLVRRFIEQGALSAPFPLGSVTDRAYFIVRTSATAARGEVNDFVDWLIAESVALVATMDTGKPVRNRASAKGR